MVRTSDTAAIVAGTLIAIALFVWVRIDEPPAATTPEGTRAAVARAVSDVPRIDLARLEAQRTPPAAGNRDVFDFAGPAAGREDAGGAPAPMPPTPPPVAIEATPPAPPSLIVRFIGCLNCLPVEKQGTKVAVLMTDKKEILTGQTGDVVANRLRIVRIGLESVDVQDVSGGAPRRLPLRAN